MFKYFKKRRYKKELNNSTIKYYVANLCLRTYYDKSKVRQIQKERKSFFKLIKPYRIKNNSAMPKLFTTLYLGDANNFTPEKGRRPEKFGDIKILLKVPESKIPELKDKFRAMDKDSPLSLMSLSHIYYERTYSGLFNRIYYSSKEIPIMEGSECGCVRPGDKDADPEHDTVEPEYQIPTGNNVISRCGICGETLNFLTNKEMKKIKKQFEKDFFRSFYSVIDS